MKLLIKIIQIQAIIIAIVAAILLCLILDPVTFWQKLTTMVINVIVLIVVYYSIMIWAEERIKA